MRATAIVNGVAVATWTRRRGGIAIEPFAPLPATVATELERDAADVCRFGQPR